MSERGRGRGDKYRAVVDAALAAFAADGYSRAGIDAIAHKAGVSTRTLYNHFRNKAGLFEAVIQESAARVAKAQTALIDRHLHKVTDLEADLVELGLALQEPAHEHALHAALVRH
ncbi:MAG: TetR/AcrR family transcriptional regulator, partial [Streptomyces sp.]|nr:TetR/AcrR family transcriptional regulator [Streptomyces sp.]